MKEREGVNQRMIRIRGSFKSDNEKAADGMVDALSAVDWLSCVNRRNCAETTVVLLFLLLGGLIGGYRRKQCKQSHEND